MSRGDDPNDYFVHERFLEKGKEKFNKMKAKQNDVNGNGRANLLLDSLVRTQDMGLRVG